MHTQHFLLLGSLLISGLTRAEDVWLFLKDGRVGLGDPAAKPLVVKFADETKATIEKDQIQGQRTPQQVEAAVDAIIGEMARGKNLDSHAERLRTLKSAATAQLLVHAQSATAVVRICALYSLQFCWSPAALDPVVKALSDKEKDVRRSALASLSRNMKEEVLAGHVAGLENDPDPEIAGFAFEVLQKQRPDTSGQQIMGLLSAPASRKRALKFLSHYFSFQMTIPTLAMIDKTRPGTIEEQRAAIVALIGQNARTPAARERLTALLASPHAEIRELAAEYFTWLGVNDDVAALTRAASVERDAYAKASIEGAIKAIGRRERAIEALPADGAAVAKGATAEEKFANALSAMATPSRATLKSALNIYESALTFEPHFVSANSAESGDAASRLRSRLAQVALFAPCGDTENATEFSDSIEYPAAPKLLAPLRDYFDAKRKSFGHSIGSDGGVFSNSVHVGDDCAWEKELRTVVAIGNGVVREAGHIFRWGHIIIIEHTGADGKPFCSLYGHLSPFMLVKPGDIVGIGQKIGSIGRTRSVDNGGYGSHLHFGIHNGSFANVRTVGEQMAFFMSGEKVTGKVVQSDASATVVELESGKQIMVPASGWVCGYVSPERWSNGTHGWQDPQAVLQQKK